MKNAIQKLETLLQAGQDYLASTPQSQLEARSSPTKWSKKEILGHLIDSAINNLQRFTEIQHAPKPFQIRKYDQNALILANHYQTADIEKLLNLWLALNQLIIYIMQQQDDSSLAFEIQIDANHFSDLRFLMTDYVDHLEHHLKAIFA